jgi:hypothetical protein
MNAVAPRSVEADRADMIQTLDQAEHGDRLGR